MTLIPRADGLACIRLHIISYRSWIHAPHILLCTCPRFEVYKAVFTRIIKPWMKDSEANQLVRYSRELALVRVLIARSLLSALSPFSVVFSCVARKHKNSMPVLRRVSARVRLTPSRLLCKFSSPGRRA